MLIGFHLLLILCDIALTEIGDQQVFMDPRLLNDALSELVTSKYLDDLAEAFASKAADKFIDAVHKKQMFIKASRFSKAGKRPEDVRNYGSFQISIPSSLKIYKVSNIETGLTLFSFDIRRRRSLLLCVTFIVA